MPSYSKPNFPSPTGHGTSKSPQSQLSNGSQTPTNSHAGDSDSTLRANPLTIMDLEEVRAILITVCESEDASLLK